MSIQRVPDVPFAQIANSALRDKRLSFKARGVLALVLSNVGEWEATLRWLINQSDRDGRHAIQQALNELTECGYREVRKCIIDGVATTVVEWRHEPISRLTENPTVGKSDDRETGVSYRTPSNRTPLEEHHPKKGATSAPSDDNRLAQEITKTYTDRVPLSKFVAVLGIVKRALKADYTAEQITDSLAALADEGRPVTVDTLRIQMDGTQAVPKSMARTQRLMEWAASQDAETYLEIAP